MKRILKIIGILTLTIILFRGFFYRILIKYDEIGTRNEIIITDKLLIKKIESESKNKNLSIVEISKIANKITSKELKFTFNQASSNPNNLIKLKKANCIGYSAMYNSISNYLIRKNQLQSKYKSIHKVGQLKILGMNIHNFFDDPFMSDHDYNEIRSLTNDEKILIDPTLSDYLKVNRICER